MADERALPIAGLRYTEVQTGDESLPGVSMYIELDEASGTLVMQVASYNLTGRDEVVKLLRATADTLLITGLGQDDSQPAESRDQVDSTPARRPFNPQPRGTQ